MVTEKNPISASDQSGIDQLIATTLDYNFGHRVKLLILQALSEALARTCKTVYEAVFPRSPDKFSHNIDAIFHNQKDVDRSSFNALHELEVLAHDLGDGFWDRFATALMAQTVAEFDADRRDNLDRKMIDAAVQAMSGKLGSNGSPIAAYVIRQFQDVLPVKEIGTDLYFHQYSSGKSHAERVLINFGRRLLFRVFPQRLWLSASLWHSNAFDIYSNLLKYMALGAGNKMINEAVNLLRSQGLAVPDSVGVPGWQDYFWNLMQADQRQINFRDWYGCIGKPQMDLLAGDDGGYVRDQYADLFSDYWVKSSGSSCFSPETKVLLEGGRTEPISSIKRGDRVITGRDMVPGEVLMVAPAYRSDRELYQMDGIKARFTDLHPFVDASRPESDRHYRSLVVDVPAKQFWSMQHKALGMKLLDDQSEVAVLSNDAVGSMAPKLSKAVVGEDDDICYDLVVRGQKGGSYWVGETDSESNQGADGGPFVLAMSGLPSLAGMEFTAEAIGTCLLSLADTFFAHGAGISHDDARVIINDIEEVGPFGLRTMINEIFVELASKNYDELEPNAIAGSKLIEQVIAAAAEFPEPERCVVTSLYTHLESAAQGRIEASAEMGWRKVHSGEADHVAIGLLDILLESDHELEDDNLSLVIEHRKGDVSTQICQTFDDSRRVNHSFKRCFDKAVYVKSSDLEDGKIVFRLHRAGVDTPSLNAELPLPIAGKTSGKKPMTFPAPILRDDNGRIMGMLNLDWRFLESDGIEAENRNREQWNTRHSVAYAQWVGQQLSQQLTAHFISTRGSRPSDPLPPPHSGFAAISVGGDILALGGNKPWGRRPGASVETVQIYDPDGGGWAMSPIKLNRPLDHMAVVAYDHKIYVTGGYALVKAPGDKTGKADFIDDVVVIDPNEASPVARSVSKLNDVRFNHAAVVVGSKLYVIGGHGPKGRLTASVEVADLAQSNPVFQILTQPLDNSREGHSVVAIGTRIFVIGGSMGRELTRDQKLRNKITPEIAVLDASVEGATWKIEPFKASPELAFSATVAIDSTIFLFGGVDADNNIHDCILILDVDEPDPVVRTSIFKLSKPRGNSQAVVVGDDIYVMGGSVPGSKEPDNTVEIFSATWLKMMCRR